MMITITLSSSLHEICIMFTESSMLGRPPSVKVTYRAGGKTVSAALTQHYSTTFYTVWHKVHFISTAPTGPFM